MVNSFFEQVYRVVRRIPPGQVATYGQIARILGAPRAARTVGWALHDVPEGSDVPWQRVVNARGAISLERRGMGGAIQRALLEEEGVRFDLEGHIDLAVYGWAGPDLAEEQELRSPTGGPGEAPPGD
ncbi:MAG TPA: MGMT family protein [Anaerolineae bacterium]|nr:MGMT family protein [Anaerolineae bacterium]